MIKIDKITNGNSLTLSLSGRLDSVTSSELEDYVRSCLDNVSLLVFDFAGLEYVSSAGLRVILMAQKTMTHKGKMVVRKVCPTVMEVFEMTGFSTVLTIEH